MPVEEPTVAVAVLLLVQVPPVVASANVVVAPTQTEAVPVIPTGAVHKTTSAHHVSHSLTVEALAS